MKAAITITVVTILLVVATFAQSDSLPSIQVKGDVVPAWQTDVKPKTFGRIRKLHFAIGDRVKAGDLLVEIDVLSAEEALGKRDTKLTSEGLPKADRETLPNQNTSSMSKIYAPRAGVVAALPVVEGQVVSPGTVKDFGTTLMRIWDDSTLTIHARVPEADATKVALKQLVQFTAESLPGVQMEARVSYIAPHAPLSTEKSVLVRAVIEKPNPQFRAVRTVQLTIPTAAH